MGEKTFWNGEPCIAKKVRVVVGPSEKDTWWCAGLVGKERSAVRVEYQSYPWFYLDDESGSGWYKVTQGKGSPGVPHASLPVEREVS